jgi:hypothetical protein
MIDGKWEHNWQEDERRFEPAIVLTLTLGMAIAAFLAMIS